MPRALRATAAAAALVLALGAQTPSIAADESALIVQESPHSVTATLDRLEAAVRGAGATVFARIDHAAGAEAAGLEMRPAAVLIFGNPKLGTPMMQAEGAMALDLPLRVAAFETADGATRLVYRDIRIVAEAHGVEVEAVAKAAGALEALTAKAVAAE